MSKHQDFSASLLRRVDEFGEYFTVKATGQSGMSHRGLARLIGKNHSSVTRWAERTREADLVQNDLPECFKPFAGRSLTLVQYEDLTGRDILTDLFCFAIVRYFASEAPEEQRTDSAKAAETLIGNIGMRKFIHTKTGWHPSFESDEFEAELKHHNQRLKTRIALKEVFRVELMEAIKSWQKRHKASRRVFWEAQDAVNTRLQGLKSQEIKMNNGFPRSTLIRDYFDAEPLIDYSAINRLAANMITTKGVHPVEAVNHACDLYLKPGFSPTPLPILENIYKADKRLVATKIAREKLVSAKKGKQSEAIQLSLFSV